VASEYLTPHFTVAEMACSCCGDAPMDPGFMAQLEALRLEYGQPMVISSGYRCPAYNVRVASTGASGPHTTGRAADVLVSGPGAYTLLRLALAHGFTGIGIKQHGRHTKRFMHLDNLNGTLRPQPCIWSYR